MSTRYEFVAVGKVLDITSTGRSHAQVPTIADAVSTIRSAGRFVVAVENEVGRPLTEAGESDPKIYRDHMNRMKPRAA